MVSNFLFHRVNPQRDALWDPMDVSLFEKCIKYISQNFTVRQLEELVADEKDFGSKKKFATIVFDDGYKDNIQYAAPILEKHHVKASFYVVTSCIEQNLPTWTHILDYSFQFSNKNDVDLFYDFLPVELRIKNFRDKKAKLEYVRKLKPALKKIPDVQRAEVIRQVQKNFDDVHIPQFMMSWQDLQQLKSAGHYIGSHTVTHSMLGNMDDEEEVKNELLESGKKIQEKLGHFPITISYPIGSYNATTIAISKQAGYKIGLAVKQRAFDPVTDDLFEIPRIELYNESWLKTRLRIDGVMSRVSKFFGAI